MQLTEAHRLHQTSVSYGEEVEILKELGLTFTQAKVYLALVELGPSSAMAISEVSHVARQDNYRILSSLQGLGLVEKVIDSPILFRPVLMQDCLPLLFEKRKQKLSELKAKLNHLISNHLSIVEEVPLNDCDFILIRERAQIFRKMVDMMRKTQLRVDVVGSFRAVSQAANFLVESAKAVLERGAEFRLITEELGDELYGPRILHSLCSPNLKLRYVRCPLNVTLGIHDGKEAIVYVYSKGKRMPPPSLYSNSPSFVVVCQNHFEHIWNSALEYNFEK